MRAEIQRCRRARLGAQPQGDALDRVGRRIAVGVAIGGEEGRRSAAGVEAVASGIESAASWPSRRRSSVSRSSIASGRVALRAKAAAAAARMSARQAATAHGSMPLEAAARAARNSWCSTAPASMPMAVKTPGAGGKSTRASRGSRARSQACTGPEPPKARSARSRGSRPRSTVTARMARTMLALATARMPSAASSTVRPSGPREIALDAPRGRSTSSGERRRRPGWRAGSRGRRWRR